MQAVKLEWNNWKAIEQNAKYYPRYTTTSLEFFSTIASSMIYFGYTCMVRTCPCYDDEMLVHCNAIQSLSAFLLVATCSRHLPPYSGARSGLHKIEICYTPLISFAFFKE